MSCHPFISNMVINLIIIGKIISVEFISIEHTIQMRRLNEYVESLNLFTNSDTIKITLVKLAIYAGIRLMISIRIAIFYGYGWNSFLLKW